MSTMSLLEIARAKWDFLKVIHPLFLYSESLPSGDSADAGRHGPIRDTPLQRLKNDITVLRSDIKLNIITQNQVDLDELKDEASIRDLIDELDCILELFELLVDEEVGSCIDQVRTHMGDMFETAIYLFIRRLGSQNALQSIPSFCVYARFY